MELPPLLQDLGAEACLTHLREQIDFNENRQKLNKVQAGISGHPWVACKPSGR